RAPGGTCARRPLSAAARWAWCAWLRAPRGRPRLRPRMCLSCCDPLHLGQNSAQLSAFNFSVAVQVLHDFHERVAIAEQDGYRHRPDALMPEIIGGLVIQHAAVLAAAIELDRGVDPEKLRQCKLVER